MLNIKFDGEKQEKMHYHFDKYRIFNENYLGFEILVLLLKAVSEIVDGPPKLGGQALKGKASIRLKSGVPPTAG